MSTCRSTHCIALHYMLLTVVVSRVLICPIFDNCSMIYGPRPPTIIPCCSTHCIALHYILLTVVVSRVLICPIFDNCSMIYGPRPPTIVPCCSTHYITLHYIELTVVVSRGSNMSHTWYLTTVQRFMARSPLLFRAAPHIVLHRINSGSF